MAINMYLHEQITSKHLSQICYLSLSNAPKIFKQMGLRLYCYIKSCRLSEATKVLRDSDKKVLDVTLDFLFDSHNGFI